MVVGAGLKPALMTPRRVILNEVSRAGRSEESRLPEETRFLLRLQNPPPLNLLYRNVPRQAGSRGGEIYCWQNRGKMPLLQELGSSAARGTGTLVGAGLALLRAQQAAPLQEIVGNVGQASRVPRDPYAAFCHSERNEESRLPLQIPCSTSSTPLI